MKTRLLCIIAYFAFAASGRSEASMIDFTNRTSLEADATMPAESLSLSAIIADTTLAGIITYRKPRPVDTRHFNKPDGKSLPRLLRLLIPLAVLGALYVVVKKEKLDIPAIPVTH
jgi:hypothetical protein